MLSSVLGGKSEEKPKEKREKDPYAPKIIYPAYLNKRKTVSQGRRVPIDCAVEEPSLMEIAELCKHLGYSVEIQSKAYSRDWLQRGRVSVKLYKEDKTLVNPEINSKKKLLLKIGPLIPKMQLRVNRKIEPAPVPTPLLKREKKKTGKREK